MAFDIFTVMMVAALAGYISFSRMTYILADEKLLPAFFHRLHKKFRTPYISLAITYVVSLLLISAGGVETILAIYAIGSLINYIMIAIALAKASRSGTLHSAFKTPLIAGIPLSAWIALALLPVGLGLTLIEKYPYLWMWILWIAAGALFYYIKRHA